LMVLVRTTHTRPRLERGSIQKFIVDVDDGKINEHVNYAGGFFFVFSVRFNILRKQLFC
jgi:hypothetical protein